MNGSLRLVAGGAAAVVALGVIAITFWPRSGGIASPGASPSPTPSVAASPTQSAAASPASSDWTVREGPLAAGEYVFVPCTAPPCPTWEDPILVTIDVPSGWSGVVPSAVWIDENAAPGGAALAIGFGGNLPRDPCVTTTDLISTGSTVDEFANAMAAHPLIDATDPVEVTLGGYSGKYIDLHLPADLSACREFRPWEPGIYAQGPDHQWHLWILDVAGTRIVVQAMDYPGTSPQRRAELQAMVDSITIEP